MNVRGEQHMSKNAPWNMKINQKEKKRKGEGKKVIGKKRKKKSLYKHIF